ncbi:MAG: ATPase domain-containing protein [Desulfurococcaceae archaeon]
MPDLTTGLRELDLLMGELRPKSMLLIVGHPGSGKTTLASKICYSNALRGHKCLFITFYEDKEKLYRNMGKLGINLQEAESKQLLTYVKLPVASPEEIMNIISTLVVKDLHKVVVIDSINTALELLPQKQVQKAVLLNYFYQLINVIGGLLILVAEIPLGSEELDLGSVEFIADCILYLKHRVARGLLSRVLEVRKLRGSPISVVELPFDILEKEGVKVFLPPRPLRAISIEENPLNSTLTLTGEMVGSIRRGDVIYIEYPAAYRSPIIIIPMIDVLVTNKLKGLFISYKYSVDEVYDAITSGLLIHTGLSRETIGKILGEHMLAESINPGSSALPHLHAKAVDVIERFKPDVIFFHGVELFSALAEPREYWTALINELLWLKNNGKLVVRLGSRVHPYWSGINSSISDLVIRLYYRRKHGSLAPIIACWRRGHEPTEIEIDEGVIRKLKEDARKLESIIQGC